MKQNGLADGVVKTGLALGSIWLGRGFLDAAIGKPVPAAAARARPAFKTMTLPGAKTAHGGIPVSKTQKRPVDRDKAVSGAVKGYGISLIPLALIAGAFTTTGFAQIMCLAALLVIFLAVAMRVNFKEIKIGIDGITIKWGTSHPR